MKSQAQAAHAASLSVVIIACNEARRIERCLRSVDFADELIVVDSGSDDETLDIARRLGARVEVRPDWAGFGIQKNRALDLATGDWILSIDADEMLTERLRDAIREALHAPEHDAYWMRRRSCFAGRPLRFGDWYGDRVLRLFRRGAARFTDDAVHERLDFEQQAGLLDGRLMHFTLDSVADALDKGRRYGAAAAPRLAARGRGGLLSAISHSSWTFVRGLVFRLGFLDGWFGLVLAACNAYGTWQRYRMAGRLRQSALR